MGSRSNQQPYPIDPTYGEPTSNQLMWHIYSSPTQFVSASPIPWCIWGTGSGGYSNAQPILTTCGSDELTNFEAKYNMIGF